MELNQCSDSHMGYSFMRWERTVTINVHLDRPGMARAEVPKKLRSYTSEAYDDATLHS